MFAMVKTRPKLTPQQEAAEKEAIRMLTQAQKLLMDSDENVDEAKRIRFEVTDRLLPPNRLFIVGKHPRSLLRDLDRRISGAYFRLTQDGMFHHVVSAPRMTRIEKPVQGVYLGKKTDYAKINQEIQSRYEKASRQIKSQPRFSGGWLVLIFVAMILIVLAMQNFYGTNSLNNSFNWLPPR